MRTELTTVAGGARPSPLVTRQLPVYLGLLVALAGTGCRLMRNAADLPASAVRTVTPGQKAKATVDPVEIQQTLVRFADEFATRMALNIDLLQRGTNPISRAEALRWKIAFDTEITAIVSRPNAVADLLDLTVLVTVTRAALEEHWRPEVFGPSAQPMLDDCRNAETNIWRMTGMILTTNQQTDLRRAIELWRQQNPLPKNVLAARAVGFATQMAEKEKTSTPNPNSLLNLLSLDPLSGLDPATREIAQTRLFAERALYVTQKMPTLLRWQTELLSLNVVEMPEVQQLVTNSTQLAASVERYANVAESLPKLLSAEREEILKALQSQERSLTPLVAEVRLTLTAGSQMSTSLNTTLTTFDALMKRFGVGETNRAGPPKTNAEPFRIRDYGQTAVLLEAATRQLTELLRTLDQTLGSTNLAQLSAQVGPVVEKAQASGKQVVDYAFKKALLLVAVLLAAGLIYGFLGARLTRVTTPGSRSP